jgi:SAM-dependent methyltransferase
MSGPASPEFHVWESAPSEADIDRLVASWRPHLGRRILDVGCGEGHVLAGLRRAGFDAEGVDMTPELVSRAARSGAPVAQGDALGFIRAEGHRFDTFLMIDFVEHVAFETVTGILDALPPGSRCMIQTPNTNSIIGHQFYLQVPSHITPLSPMILDKMLSRAGMSVQAKGTVWGGLPWTGLRRRLTLFLLEKVFGVTMLPLLIQGANYYVVAEKRSAGASR